jgi:hypothetical protein
MKHVNCKQFMTEPPHLSKPGMSSATLALSQAANTVPSLYLVILEGLSGDHSAIQHRKFWLCAINVYMLCRQKRAVINALFHWLLHDKRQAAQDSYDFMPKWWHPTGYIQNEVARDFPFASPPLGSLVQTRPHGRLSPISAGATSVAASNSCLTPICRCHAP